MESTNSQDIINGLLNSITDIHSYRNAKEQIIALMWQARFDESAFFKSQEYFDVSENLNQKYFAYVHCNLSEKTLTIYNLILNSSKETERLVFNQCCDLILTFPTNYIELTEIFGTLIFLYGYFDDYDSRFEIVFDLSNKFLR